ncbi:hypothetical protein BCR34DRAFT_240240 [Clohesyomyces aquaticus]|uniref:Uncharacterized protein n=1 Tax=Clohesyomyces aquaticus TaxID=1231657 RepID=A0A1Y1Y5T2_9PLEO|nr:hypothetical protein BCR34DRAFT_240240 [Clohesyomyces aquaticus]
MASFPTARRRQRTKNELVDFSISCYLLCQPLPCQFLTSAPRRLSVRSRCSHLRTPAVFSYPVTRSILSLVVYYPSRITRKKYFHPCPIPSSDPCSNGIRIPMRLPYPRISGQQSRNDRRILRTLNHVRNPCHMMSSHVLLTTSHQGPDTENLSAENLSAEKSIRRRETRVHAWVRCSDEMC